MECPKWRTENPKKTKFCGDCGTRIRGHVPDSPEAGTCSQNSKKTPASGMKERASFTRTLEITADELGRGTVFAGRYEIIEELGAGGMGRVYRAFDKKIDEEVALKLLKPGSNTANSSTSGRTPTRACPTSWTRKNACQPFR